MTEPHDPPAFWNHVLGAALVEIPTYVYVWILYAVFCGVIPGVSITVSALQLTLMLVTVAMLGGLLALHLPGVCVRALFLFGTAAAIIVFIIGLFSQGPGYALAISMFLLAAVKCSHFTEFAAESVGDEKARMALEIRTTIALIIEMTLLFIGLFAAHTFYPFA